LQKALAINPENKAAIDGLNSVNQLLAAAEPDDSDELFEKLALAKNGNHSEGNDELIDSSLALNSEVHVCPFCELPKNFDTIFCEACHALQSFDDVEKLFVHTGVKEEILDAAIKKLENEKLKTDLTSGELMQLGLAYFNIKNFEKGLATLEETLVKEPNNFPLETTISMIKLRNSEPVQSPATEAEIAESPSTETAAMDVSADSAEIVPESETDHESVSAAMPVLVSGYDEVPVAPIPQPKEPLTQTDDKARAKVIMVVDGSPTVRKLVSAKLETNGFKVILATNGAEAIAKLDETTPDLVLLDIEMPHLDGYEVCKLIRETESAKNVPVILISEMGFVYEEQKGKTVGANGHITKPFGPGTLMKTVGSFLS
jgi:CheY-like chemotaxis protein